MPGPRVSHKRPFAVHCRAAYMRPPGCRKTLVGASIARPCPFALQENCPGKCVAAVSWRATNGRPYTRNKAGMQFFDDLRSGQDRSLQSTRERHTVGRGLDPSARVSGHASIPGGINPSPATFPYTSCRPWLKCTLCPAAIRVKTAKKIPLIFYKCSGCNCPLRRV